MLIYTKTESYTKFEDFWQSKSASLYLFITVLVPTNFLSIFFLQISNPFLRKFKCFFHQFMSWKVQLWMWGIRCYALSYVFNLKGTSYFVEVKENNWNLSWFYFPRLQMFNHLSVLTDWLNVSVSFKRVIFVLNLIGENDKGVTFILLWKQVIQNCFWVHQVLRNIKSSLWCIFLTTLSVLNIFE